MAFGPIMKLTTESGLDLELAPFTREEATTFADSFAHHSVIQYVTNRVQTKETEEEWYDKMIKDRTSRMWGIWVIEGDERRLIGNSALTDMELRKHIRQAVSGSVICDASYWGRGIASACHKARTYFAFEQLGLHRIKSAVLQPNGGSRKALERSGYILVYTERNETFVNGALVHMDCLECLNPADWAWQQWWGGDRPTQKSMEARKRTEAALEWARENVELA